MITPPMALVKHPAPACPAQQTNFMKQTQHEGRHA